MVRISVCVNGNRGGITIISRILAIEKDLEFIPRKNEECVLECTKNDKKYLRVKQIYHYHIDTDDKIVKVVLSEINGSIEFFEEISNFLMNKGWMIEG